MRSGVVKHHHACANFALFSSQLFHVFIEEVLVVHLAIFDDGEEVNVKVCVSQVSK
jgi:hypothetical protein